MDTFADYILGEENLAAKMEITYYLAKKTKVFFDKSVVFKTELTRLFLNYSKIQVDNNFVLTASLLCNCKKVDNAQDIEQVHSYAKKGAEYLSTLGFGKKFCKVCEEINRYSDSNPRERESDILELTDQFGGMLLDRPERIGFKPDEALVLLEYRNLKDKYNRYLNTFMDFVNFMQKIEMNETAKIPALEKLVKVYNDNDDLVQFIKEVMYGYEPAVDKAIKAENRELAREMFDGDVHKADKKNRALFSEETTKKILAKIKDSKLQEEDV